ncbi:MAG: hypothetical protein EAY75_06240 [Bacteroidetes bacterium]|nr:MAG: hypothetical protein EAY75_06240 [Bacteroidota bacterium]
MLAAVPAIAQTKPNGSTTPALAPLAAPAAYPGTMLVNYVRTWEAMQPIQNPTQAQLDNPALYKQATAYFDGLGRPLQEVVKGGSPDGWLLLPPSTAITTPSLPTNAPLPKPYLKPARSTARWPVLRRAMPG